MNTDLFVAGAWHHRMTRFDWNGSVWNMTQWFDGVKVLQDGAGVSLNFDATAYKGTDRLVQIWIGNPNPTGAEASVDTRGSFRDQFFAPVAVSDADMLAIYQRSKTPAQIGATWWVGLNGISDLANKINPGVGDLIAYGGAATDATGPT
jgi:hypothetical protein